MSVQARKIVWMRYFNIPIPIITLIIKFHAGCREKYVNYVLVQQKFEASFEKN